MKPTITTTPLLLLLLLPAAPIAAAGFYAACSKSWTLGWRGASHFVVDTCPGPGGVPITSTLDLNDCLGNREGDIEARPGGYAFNSCFGCSASADGPHITCDCPATDGFVKTSTFDLDTVVTNEDGILACFDMPGFEVGSTEL